MKSTKITKTVSVILAAIMSFGMLTACASGDKSRRSGRDRDEEEKIEVPEDKILYSYTYTNGAEGYSHSRVFIMTNGDVYCYSNSTYYYYDDTAGRRFNESDLDEFIVRYTEPLTTISEEQVGNIYKMASKLKEDASFDTSNVACDMGAYIDSVLINEDGDMLKIRESGDNQGELKEAKRLLDYIDNEVYPDISEPRRNQSNLIYTSNEIPVIQFGGMDRGNGMYVTDSNYELSSFLGEYYDQVIPSYIEDGDYVFFIETVEVNTQGYRIYSDAILFTNEGITLIPSPDNYAPGEDQMVGQAFDYFCTIFAVPRYVAESYMNSDGTYTDTNGEAFLRLTTYEEV